MPGDWLVPLPSGLSLSDAMAIGTAGFTAALSLDDMERNGLTPASGPVIVTGATGGVGSVAIQLLAKRGYTITAFTGKDEGDYLRQLGAREILLRSNVTFGTKPLEKATWAGAVDAVGGETLAWLTRTMMVGGTIASSGLAGGHELHTTVMPFILRGVKLLGIDSVACPRDRRLQVWQRLASDLRPDHLPTMIKEIGLDGLHDAFSILLKGQARGRFVVNLM